MAAGTQGQNTDGVSPPRPELKMAGQVPSDFPVAAGREAGDTLAWGLTVRVKAQARLGAAGKRRDRARGQPTEPLGAMAVPTCQTVSHWSSGSQPASCCSSSQRKGGGRVGWKGPPCACALLQSKWDPPEGDGVGGDWFPCSHQTVWCASS